MIITSDSHPHIVSAFHCIEEDSGSRLQIPAYDLPARWDPYLIKIEELIGKLSKTERAPEEEPLPPHVKPNAYLDSEFYTFCNGEHDVMIAICNRSLDHQLAHLLLTDFFEAWTYTADAGFDTPEQKAFVGRIEYLDMIEREGTIGLSAEQEREREELRGKLLS